MKASVCGFDISPSLCTHDPRSQLGKKAVKKTVKTVAKLHVHAGDGIARVAHKGLSAGGVIGHAPCLPTWTTHRDLANHWSEEWAPGHMWQNQARETPCMPPICI